MSITFFDGFDLYGSLTTVETQWGTFATPVLTTTGGRFGGGAVTCQGTDEFIAKDDVANVAYITTGFAFKTDLAVSARIFFWTRATGSVSSSLINAAVRVNANGSITLEKVGGAAAGTSAAGVVVAGQWNYMEVQVFRDNSVGSIEVFLGGTSIISATSIDTLQSTASGAFLYGTTSSSTEVVVDDTYLAQDASALPAILGDVKVSTLLPDADTAQADWTPLSGSGFSNIDDALGTDGDGNTTYISETTLNGKSEFDLEALPETPTAVHSVSMVTRASKTDAGSIEYTHHVDSSGVEETGAAVAPSETGFSLNYSYHNTDPNTASAWTESGVNAMKLGVEVTA